MHSGREVSRCRRCCVMWNEKSSSSPTSAIGRGDGDHEERDRRANKRDAPAGHRLIRGARALRTRTSVGRSRRARSARAGAGSIVQLVSSDGSSIGRDCTLGPWPESDVRGRGVSIAKADAVVERLRAAVESTGRAGFGAFAGLYRSTTDATRRVDRLGRDEAHPRRERGALAACGADLAAHCINDVDHVRRRPAVLPRLRGCEPHRARDGRRARGGCG
jgi:hypothetical protein